MKRLFALLSFAAAWLAATGQPIRLSAGSLSATVDKYGYYRSLEVGGQELLLSKELYPVVSAYDHRVHTPQAAKLQNDTLVCLMDDDQEVWLRITQLPLCLTMEVIACPQGYGSITFGPVAATASEVVGEVVGVIQEGEGALGMLSLNAKTIGGIPQEAAEDYGNKFYYHSRAIGDHAGHRLAAARIEGGAVLQLSARCRSKRRGRLEVRQTGGCPAAIASPVAGEEGSIVGSGVALFGCSRTEVLEHIGLIEQALGLPHPITAEGTWAKLAPGNNSRDGITRYKVESVVDWKEPAAAEGLATHFQPQLMFQLEEELGADETTITLLTGAYNCFPTPMEGEQVVRIEEELISYEWVQDSGGHVILGGCRRGAYGTAAAAHRKYTTGCRLWTVKEGFVADMELLDTLAERTAAELHRGAALGAEMEVIFTRLDCCALTGQDEYAVARFVSHCLKGLPQAASARADCVTNYTWHYLSGVTDGGCGALPEAEKADVEDFLKRNLLR